MRVRYAIDGGQPTVRDLAVRKTGGQWAVLGQQPLARVPRGQRHSKNVDAAGRAAPGGGCGPDARGHREESMVRVLGRSAGAARRAGNAGAGGDDYAARLDRSAGAGGRARPRTGTGAGRCRIRREGGAAQPAGRGERPRTFDPGGGLPPLPLAGRNIGEPRSAADIKRASASFNASSCSVKTDGATVEVTFPGLTMGIFAGDLRFTAYRGTNLLRMEALAKTTDEWIAYKYDGGLKGFSTASAVRTSSGTTPAASRSTTSSAASSTSRSCP